MKTPGASTATGFTLLELLIAISLMGILALLSWRGLDAVLTAREAIVERSQDLRTLSSVMTQIEEDLRRSWTVRLLGLPEQPLGFTIGDDRSPPALELLREAPGEDSSQVQRISWRLRDGVIERGFAPWTGFVGGEPGVAREVEYFWQPLVQDVDALEFRGWLAERGWLPATAVAAALSEQSALVQAASAAQTPAQSQSPARSPAPAAGGAGSQATSGSGQAQAGQESSPEAVATPPLVTGVEVVLVQRGQPIVRVFSVGH